MKTKLANLLRNYGKNLVTQALICVIALMIITFNSVGEEVKHVDTSSNNIEEVGKEIIVTTNTAMCKQITRMANNAVSTAKEIQREKENKAKKDPVSNDTNSLKNREWKTAYTTARLNVRKHPSSDSKKIGELQWNTKVKYIKFDNPDWVIIKYEKKYGYVSKKYLRKRGVKSYTKDTVHEHQKSWMDYRTITDTTSPQYMIEQTDAYTGRYGIRMVDGRYLCAVGSYYSHDVGRYVDIILENGEIIPCILGDQKDDGDTDESNMYTEHDGSVFEFVVDMDEVPSKVKISGDYNSISKWNSSVKEIRIYYYNPYDRL